jgi:hypothetical protein
LQQFAEANLGGLRIPQGGISNVSDFGRFLNRNQDKIANNPFSINAFLRRGFFVGALSTLSLLCGVKGANLLCKAVSQA